MVDIHLPDLSGLVVTQKLRQQLGAAIPIIILSGDTSMETLNSLGTCRRHLFFQQARQFRTAGRDDCKLRSFGAGTLRQGSPVRNPFRPSLAAPLAGGAYAHAIPVNIGQHAFTA